MMTKCAIASSISMRIDTAEVHSGEDFVHIDDHRPTGNMSLSDSIVNVEKDELLDEAAEKEIKDSDSFVSGGEGDEIGGGGDDDGGDCECSSETIKMDLPDEMTKSVVIQTCESTGEGGSCDVFLIGTGHVSKDSSGSGFKGYETKEDIENVLPNTFDGDEAVLDIDKDLIITDQQIHELWNHIAETLLRDQGIGGGGDDDGGQCSSKTMKVDLPDELAKSVVILTCESTAEGGSCDVFLIGTAHVSQQSCLEVETIISILKPEVVFVELCSSRLSFLEPQALEVPTMSDMIECWKQKQTAFEILYGWFLAKIASHLEVLPGAEFRVAYEEAAKYGGKVMLGDRPVQITVKRTWAKMPLWHKVKFLCFILFQGVFLPKAEKLGEILKDMDDVDMVTLVSQGLSKEFPTLMDTLVHERDQYMASSLLRVASEHRSVVAIIGKGHVNGIKKNWKQPITMSDLMEIPSNKSVFTLKRIISLVAIAVAGTAIVSDILLAIRR